MKIAIGADHAGVVLKDTIVAFLKEHGHEVVDKGTNGPDSVDYPNFAKDVAGAVAAGEVERGILICGTGVGMSMTANKVKGIRASLCNDLYTAKYSRLHNDANVLCMGARLTGPGLACDITDVWLTTEYEGGRHDRRVKMIEE